MLQPSTAHLTQYRESSGWKRRSSFMASRTYECVNAGKRGSLSRKDVPHPTLAVHDKLGSGGVPSQPLDDIEYTRRSSPWTGSLSTRTDRPSMRRRWSITSDERRGRAMPGKCLEISSLEEAMLPASWSIWGMLEESWWSFNASAICSGGPALACSRCGILELGGRRMSERASEKVRRGGSNLNAFARTMAR